MFNTFNTITCAHMSMSRWGLAFYGQAHECTINADGLHLAVFQKGGSCRRGFHASIPGATCSGEVAPFQSMHNFLHMKRRWHPVANGQRRWRSKDSVHGSTQVLGAGAPVTNSVGTVTTHGAEGRSHCGLACVGQKGGVVSASAMPVWGRGAPLGRRWDLALLGVISSRIDKRLRSLDPGEVWVIPMG